MFNNLSSENLCRLWYKVENYGWAREAANDNMARALHAG